MTENLNLKTVETVDTRPFRKLVMTIGELPTSFIESMTYYELLAWFTNYLETVIIPTVNNNGEAVEELQEKYVELKTNTEQEITDFETNLTNLFNQLKDYVDNYFENLDVQEEINNKLDQMAEAGTLQEIITTYIQSNVAWTFDNVSEMQAATNLTNNSYARTLGFYTANGGGGGLYKIRNKTESDPTDNTVISIDETLCAELIFNGTVSPEQLGCYNDQTHDDAVYIQSAIDLSKNIGVQVKFEHSIYYVSTAINMPLEYSIDFQGITLKAIDSTNFTEGMVNVKNTLNIHNGVISNLKFDQNNTAPKGLYINRSWRRTYENLDFKNTPTGGYGIYLDGTLGGAGGNQFNNITGTGNYLNSTFIYVGVNDCVFSHVDYQQYTIGIETDRFVRLFDIHGYIGTDTSTEPVIDWYTGSIFIKIDTNGRILADDLYPDTQNYSFYNASVLPSQIGKIFFTFNTVTPQYNAPSVMFKADNDNVEIYYRWRIASLNLNISDTLLFELIKNSPGSTLSSYLHLESLTVSSGLNIDNPPVYVANILPINNFTKLGIYGNNLVACGASQYGAGSAARDICRTNSRSGYKLIDGYYPYKGINPDDSSVFDGTVKVENNTVTVMPNASQKANFQFFIQVPAQEGNIVSS